MTAKEPDPPQGEGTAEAGTSSANRSSHREQRYSSIGMAEV